MSEHTNGPWHTAFEEGTKVKDSGENTVAWLQQTHLRGKRTEKEVAANARLIAAAPDLLTSCKELLEELRLIRMKDSGACCNPTCRILAQVAIEKAE